MNQHAIDGRFPKGALIGAAGLVTLSLFAAGVGRLTGLGTTMLPEVAPIESRELRFVDRADGSVAIYDEASNRLVYSVDPGTGGFVRGVLRGLARERRLERLANEPPFRMTHWADGRLSIEDPLTERRVDLGAFGPANAGAFARIFEAREETP